MKLQPKVDPSEVTDKWKLFQVDNELPAYDPRERIEVYWNKVSKLQAADGELRYKTAYSDQIWPGVGTNQCRI